MIRFVGGDSLLYTIREEPVDEFDPPIDLTVEEMNDYEETVRRWSEWQARLHEHVQKYFEAKR